MKPLWCLGTIELLIQSDKESEGKEEKIMFRGKVCVINGAAKGVGRKIAEQFAMRGCNIAFMDDDKQSGKRFQKILQNEFGVDALFFHGDTFCEEDLELFANSVVGQYDNIDFLVNNTSMNRAGWGESYDSFVDTQTALKMGVIAPYILHKSFKCHFDTGGVVVLTVPPRDFFRQEDGGAYLLVKESTEALTRICAGVHQGMVRVNCVCQEGSECFLDNENEDIARTICFLCEDKSEFINGKSMGLSGGLMKLMAYHGRDGWNIVS